MKHYGRFCVVVLISWSTLVCGDSNQPQPERVIWVTVDSLRADHLHFMGYKHATSPWLDGLSEKSVCFTRAFSPSNITYRSVPMYMTGKMQSDIFDDLDTDHDIHDSEITIAEAFRGAGFVTWWITTNGNTSEWVNLDQGVDHYHYIKPKGYLNGSMDDIARFVDENYQRSEQREFIYIHTMDAHVPYRPPYPYGGMFTKPYERAVVRDGMAYDDFGNPIMGMLPALSETHNMTQEDVDFFVGLYDGGIRYTDDYLPVLLEELDFNPTKDLLILTADHGEQFMEKGRRGHGVSVWPFEFHVPLIVQYEGFRPYKNDTPVSLLDLYPTLCSIFGIVPPPGLVGDDIVPLLKGESIQERIVRAEPYEKFGSGGIIVEGDWYYSVNTSYYKTDPGEPWPHQEVLVDMSDPRSYDPSLNVAADNEELCDSLNSILRKMHPRMALFEREVIKRPSGDLPLGADVLVSNESSLRAAVLPQLPFVKPGSIGGFMLSQVTSKTKPDQTYQFQITPKELVLEAQDLSPQDIYIFNLHYTLVSGTVTIAIADVESSETLNETVLRKTVSEGDILRALRARSSQMTVRISFGENAIGTLGKPTLRRLEAATPLPVSVRRGEEREDGREDSGEMTEEEKARARALGYF